MSTLLVEAPVAPAPVIVEPTIELEEPRVATFSDLLRGTRVDHGQGHYVGTTSEGDITACSLATVFIEAAARG